jgi:hypothetical protein
MSSQTNEYLVRCVDNPDYLLEPLVENKFVCRYSIEEFKEYFEEGKSKKFGVPMVCFCDVGEEYLAEHSLTYGDYRIYMKKEWGIRNQLLPIHYIHNENDNHVQSLRILYDYLKEGNNNFVLENVLIRLLSYIKPYKKDKKLYYDEREWRFIPQNFSSDFLLDINNNTTTSKCNKTTINEKEQDKLKLYNNYWLEFTIKDIHCVSVPDISDVKCCDINSHKELVTFCEENDIKIEICKIKVT